MKSTALKLKTWMLTAAVLGVLQVSFAQALIDSLSQDDNKIVASIAPYASDMRAAILNVSQYPQALVKLERTQARTSQSFQDLIASYPRDEQEKFYQASRFPELNTQLVALGKDNAARARELVKDYPEGSQQAIVDVYTNHFDDLARISTIYQTSEATLEKITAKYTPQLQSDFKKVVGSPDVMSLLTDNIDLTVSLGESYKSDPNGVIQYLDSLNSDLTAQNAKDLDAYKKEVENDPKLQAEMKSAADEFAKQYDQPDAGPATVSNNYYGSSPYPYWFGYPYWYSSPMWYPTPFYYNTGFYYGANGGLTVFGLPSFAYSNWFFSFGYHRYPLLYRHYNTYYNVHRANITNVNVYRGFNTAARNHFGGINHGRYTSEGRARNNASHAAINRRGSYNSQSTAPRTGGSNRGHSVQSGARPGNNFNAGSFNHYNANSFHSMGWQPMHGGGMHSMGGGGFHGGGMHGGRR
ncbi:hypothetical protein [Chryseolinea lacunae]|uniref:DUF3300 domain-containing protein n=1 Tax=Chryseolinea lacunae TaxID=2801331 RepID=A0ABS1KTL3_9BACT|nr:hypothetical protein [Chryseolinea lacunae]MBL0742714.1 hypothetical protein [Chryseolinea lacunae]